LRGRHDGEKNTAGQGAGQIKHGSIGVTASATILRASATVLAPARGRHRLPLTVRYF
jgi:hypothetical protein